MSLDKNKRKFGSRLRLARKRRGFQTAAGFAAVIEEDENTVTMWERGDRYPPPHQLNKLILALRVTSDFLLFGYMDGLTTEAARDILGKISAYSTDTDRKNPANSVA